MTSYYLAARYSRREELVRYRSTIEAHGHEVTSRWLNGDHQAEEVERKHDGAGEYSPDADAVRFALEDLEDLDRADVVVSFTEKPRSSSSRGGRHVEFGYGLARRAAESPFGPRLVVIGPRENVFHTVEAVEVFDGFFGFVAHEFEEVPS